MCTGSGTVEVTWAARTACLHKNWIVPLPCVLPYANVILKCDRDIILLHRAAAEQELWCVPVQPAALLRAVSVPSAPFVVLGCSEG